LFLETAWSDKRFVKFILVKYHYAEFDEHPLTRLFFDISTNHKLAAQYLQEQGNIEYV